jgi:hypothetical protein
MFQNASSLFEIFVGFNLAYVLVDSFSKMLNQKIVVGYNEILKKSGTIKSKIEVVQENLRVKREEAVEKNDEADLHLCRELEDKRTELEVKFSLIKADIDQKIKVSSNTPNFTFICLYGALYSLFILLLMALSNEFEEKCLAYKEVFFCFNLAGLLFIILANNNFFQKIGYHKTLWWFACATIGFIALFIIEARYCPRHEEFTWLNYVNFCLSLIIPTLHFFIALKRASVNSRLKSPSMDVVLKDFDQEFKSFNDSVETTLKTSGKLKSAGFEIKKPNKEQQTN